MSLAEFGYTYTDKNPNDPWDWNEYKILHDFGSGDGTFTRADSSQGIISYLVEYNYHERFLDVVMGRTVKVGSQLRRANTTGTWDTDQGSLPEEHPYYYNYYASSVDVKKSGKPDQTDTGPIWNKAIVSVVYRPPTYVVRDDTGYGGGTPEYSRFTTKLPESAVEYQTSQGSFYWVTRKAGGNNIPLDITPGFSVPFQKYTYVWHQIPVLTSGGYPDLGKVPNISTILAAEGKVNSADFDGFAPGTVLFLGAAQPKLVTPQTALANNYYWDVIYQFGIRDQGEDAYGDRIGWQHAFDPVAGVWDLYTTTGTTGGTKRYQSYDLTTLFQVTW